MSLSEKTYAEESGRPRKTEPFDARKAKQLEPGEHLTIAYCPGLRLQATVNRRTWSYRYRSPLDGRMRQVKIGAWPAVGVAAASTAWAKLKAVRVHGVDPTRK